MIFQDNVIKEYLKNVYFISGTPCAGKTTITRALGKKYGIPVYVIDDQFTIHQLKSDPEHQPNMNRSFRDADEFFGRTVEEYKNWLLGNSREQLDFVLMDLVRLSQNRIILCDIHLIAEDAAKITDPSRIAFLIKEPKELVDAYISRPDHRPFRDFLRSASARAGCYHDRSYNQKQKGERRGRSEFGFHSVSSSRESIIFAQSAFSLEPTYVSPIRRPSLSKKSVSGIYCTLFRYQLPREADGSI